MYDDFEGGIAAQLKAQARQREHEVRELERRYWDRMKHRAIYDTDRLVRRQYGDPGIPAADILAARMGDTKAQFRVHDWVSGLVRHAALNGLNARSRQSEMLCTATADVYAELIGGAPSDSREGAAQKAGVAKGTYVKFRATVIDPVANTMTLYMQRAALAARRIRVPRARGEFTRYREARKANKENPISQFGFVAGRVTPSSASATHKLRPPNGDGWED